MNKMLKTIFPIVFAVVLMNATAFAETKGFISEGKYILGECDSKKDAKALALLNARGQMLENAIAYLEALPEVKKYSLTRNQINTLADHMLAIDVVNEAWSSTEPNKNVTIRIQGIINTDHLHDKISRLREGDHIESSPEIQIRLADLQKELAQLKSSGVEQITAGIKEPLSKETKQKHENILRNIYSLEYLGKGNIALIDQRWNDALYVFNKAIEYNLELVDAYAGKSFALYNLNKVKEALAVVNNALKINPQSVRNLSVKAIILKDLPGKINLAFTNANDAIKLKSDSPGLYRIRAEVYAKMGKSSLAEKDFATACELGSKKSCEKTKVINVKQAAEKKM
jgi:tetratricopeptide (TPR) repeat protein